MYKVVENVQVISSKQYENEIRELVEMGSLWGAIKGDEGVEVIDYLGFIGLAYKGEVFTLRDITWNEMHAMARVDPDTSELYKEPLFPTISEPSSVKMGSFDEVFKRGYIVFPLGAYKDMKNRPIALRKG